MKSVILFLSFTLLFIGNVSGDCYSTWYSDLGRCNAPYDRAIDNINNLYRLCLIQNFGKATIANCGFNRQASLNSTNTWRGICLDVSGDRYYDCVNRGFGDRDTGGRSGGRFGGSEFGYGGGGNGGNAGASTFRCLGNARSLNQLKACMKL